MICFANLTEAIIHPANLTEADFKEIRYPILFIPTKEEATMVNLRLSIYF